MTLFCYVPSRLFYSTLLRVFPSSKQLINKLPEPRVAWLLSLASLYQHQHQHQHPSPPHRAIWPLTYIQYEVRSTKHSHHYLLLTQLLQLDSRSISESRYIRRSKSGAWMWLRLIIDVRHAAVARSRPSLLRQYRTSCLRYEIRSTVRLLVSVAGTC
jgi:hypothetical protein